MIKTNKDLDSFTDDLNEISSFYYENEDHIEYEIDEEDQFIYEENNND